MEISVAMNDFSSVKAGEPLSVTRTVTVLVDGAPVVGGAHKMTPLVGPMLIPGGGLMRLKESWVAGWSGSEAEFVSQPSAPATWVWFARGDSTGAAFTSRTITETLLVSLEGGVPSSVTATVIVFVLGP